MRIILSILFAATLSLSANLAQAQQPKQLTASGNWQAFVVEEGGEKVCYMASQPVDAKGNYSKRGEVYALVTHRPSEGTRNVFSYITGYDYKSGSDAKLKIDNETFVLFTQDDTAWAPDANTDNRITEQIRKGSRMVVTGTSSRGTATTDTFSLSGSSAAYEAITKACP